MFRRIVLTIAISVLSAFGTPATADIGAWPKLTWRMSHEQALIAYPNFETWIQSDPAWDFNNPLKMENVEHFGLKEHSAGGCKFSVSLKFDDNNLYQLEMREITHEDCFDAVSKGLLSSYGRPVKVEIKKPSNRYEFRHGGTVIVYVTENSPIKERVLQIIYSDSEYIKEMVDRISKNPF